MMKMLYMFWIEKILLLILIFLQIKIKMTLGFEKYSLENWLKNIFI